MTDRIIEISRQPAKLSVREKNLVIQTENGVCSKIPLCDIATLVIANPRVSISHAVLTDAAAEGSIVVVCDAKFLPVAMLCPLQGHSTLSERMRAQAAAPLPLRKRLWQKVVHTKIVSQAAALERVAGNDGGLRAIAGRVRSGDPDNQEGRTAQIYWRRIFGDPNFSRDRYANDQNRMLNYGYAVLRSIVARAICSSGLHPALGLHHHNRYDPFCLASDLMEIFRSQVDLAVVKTLENVLVDAPLDQKIRSELLESLLGRVNFKGQKRSLFDVSTRMTSSLAAVYLGEKKNLLLPEF